MYTMIEMENSSVSAETESDRAKIIVTKILRFPSTRVVFAKQLAVEISPSTMLVYHVCVCVCMYTLRRGWHTYTFGFCRVKDVRAEKSDRIVTFGIINTLPLV